MPLKPDLDEAQIEKLRNAALVTLAYFLMAALGCIGAIIWRIV